MKKFIFIACLCASSSALAESAIWTGNKQQIETLSGQVAWKCEYKVAFTTQMILFWRVFPSSCPYEVEVYY